MFPQIVGLLFGCAYPLHPLNLRYIREKSFEMKREGIRSLKLTNSINEE